MKGVSSKSSGKFSVVTIRPRLAAAAAVTGIYGCSFVVKRDQIFATFIDKAGGHGKPCG